MTNSIGHMMELIDRYWDLAYAEGRDGRTCDTPDGKAACTRKEIEEELHELFTTIKNVNTE